MARWLLVWLPLVLTALRAPVTPRARLYAAGLTATELRACRGAYDAACDIVEFKCARRALLVPHATRDDATLCSIMEALDAAGKPAVPPEDEGLLPWLVDLWNKHFGCMATRGC